MWRTITILFFSLFVMAACADSKTEIAAHKMSERFDLCINLPNKSSYHLVKESIDYDIGRLSIDKSTIDVYIGQNPPFSGELWTKEVSTTPEFILVGKENLNGAQKILIGHKRYANRGPLFVMFSAQNLVPTEKYLLEKDFVFDCVATAKNDSGKEKWRQP
jgi:type I restriction-modification system DNA methylase subunit